MAGHVEEYKVMWSEYVKVFEYSEAILEIIIETEKRRQFHCW